MKKINLSLKAKKSIIITGSALVCVAVAAIALHMDGGVTAAAQTQSAAASSSPSTSAVVSVPPIEQQSETESGTGSAFVPSSGASQSAELTTISKPTSAPPTPSAASGTNLTDKTKKPTYTSKPTAKSKTPASNKPKAGDIKDGKMYDPEFGWVTIGGTNKQTTVEGDWGGGSQVGIMD